MAKINAVSTKTASAIPPLRATNWGSIYLVCTVCILDSIRYSIINVNIWAYLKSLDPNVTEQFFGLTNAAQTICIIVSSLFCGWLCNQILSTKPTILFGALLLTFNCLFYANLERLFEIGRRKWFLMGAQMLIGISGGMLMTFRVHVAMRSVEKDRQKANSIVQFGIQIGSILGSVFVLLLDQFLQVWGPFDLPWGGQFNLYTGPAYFEATLALLTFALIFISFDGRMLLKEMPAGNGEINQKIDVQFGKPALDYLAIGACIFARICFNAMNIYSGSLSGPYSMMVFGWNGQQTVYYFMIVEGVSGLFGILLSLGGTFHLMDRLKPRLGVLLSMTMFFGFFLFTFPWPFLTNKIPEIVYQNTTLPNGTKQINELSNGCDPSQFEWCHSMPAINMPVYLIGLIIMQGIAVPLGFINMDVLYSRLLGQIKQGTWQGLMIAIGDFVNVGGPLLITSFYRSNGPQQVWLAEMAVFVLGIAIWGSCYRRLRVRKN